MKAILLAATIYLSFAGQNPSQDKSVAPDDQGVKNRQTVSLAQPPAPPLQGQQPRQGPATPAQEPQGPNLVIEEVIFEGNNVFSSWELARQLRLVSPNIFLRGFGRRNVYTRERFQEDAARLTRYMTERGYLNAAVGEPKIRFINIADAARTSGDVPIRLIIPITEGPRHRLGKLIIRGGSVLTPGQARALFPLKEGEVINAGVLEASLVRLRDLYGSLGYLQFAPRLDFAPKPSGDNEVVTDVTITLNEGKRFTIGRLTFVGNRRTLDLYIRRMVPLDEGEYFDYGRLQEAVERFNRTGLFEPIKPGDIIINYDVPQGVANVELHLTERDVQRIDFSGGGGSTGGFNAGVDYSNISLTGRLDSFAGQMRLGNLEQLASAQYTNTLLTARPVTISLSGFYQRYRFVEAGAERRPLYIQTSGGMTTGVTIPIARGRNSLAAATRASVFYSLNFTRLRDLTIGQSPGVSDVEQDSFRLAGFTPTLTHDTLERSFDPARGLRFTSGVETNGRIFGGNINTVRPWIDFRQFFPLHEGLRGERNVFGYRLRAGHISPYGRPFNARTLSLVDGIPISSRYFLGGDTEVRGYPINSIAPLARIDRLLASGDNPPVLISSDVQPIGSDTELIGNAEYRAPLFWRLSGAVFFDIGAALNIRGLPEQQFISPVQTNPPTSNTFLVTALRPLGDLGRGIPNYRISTGFELRFLVPVARIPLRLIFAYNPNAQTSPPPATFLAPEKRFAFRIGFGRTL
ncbi:MAG TPA: BamA/TamA family outer membrane protein [Blastocatellia bacterium]|nr:BamA/TamA family outer membrane protein [Blastocatellia bacterium]